MGDGGSGGNRCEGPLIWYPCEGGAVLYCSTCGHLTVTGNFHEVPHSETPLLMEGLSA